DALTATLVTSTTHGSLTLNANGSFGYTPVTDFLGTDGFTYRARDPGGLTSSASVTIQVTMPAPVAIVFTPVADAYTRRNQATSHFGTATDLRLRLSNQWEFRTYLRFNVSAFNGTLVSATLRLYAADGSSDGGSVYPISNTFLGTTTPWTETGINWGNGPDL